MKNGKKCAMMGKNTERGQAKMADGWQGLLSRTRAAIERYGMITSGDRVAVGVSGGKDSVALLTLLAQLQKFLPVPFSLTAITLDPCFLGREGDYTAIAELCERLDVPYVLRRTRLYDVVFVERAEKNPCSLCARMRRGALHKAAQNAGCNVVALGHHKDDAAETLLMNLLSGGRIDCFSPKSRLDRRQLTLIRPLIFADERQIAAAVRQQGLPVVKSACPADGCTNRQRTKELIKTLSAEYGPLTDKLLTAMQTADIAGWGGEEK